MTSWRGLVPRSWVRVDEDTRQPSSTAPMTRSSGTNTSARNTSLKSDSPVSWRSGRTSTPWARMSTAKAVMPACLRTVGVGAGQAQAPVGELGVGGPHLLAVERPAADPVALGADGPGRERSQVAAGVGLAEQLAEEHVGRQDGGQPTRPLLVGAVGQQRGPDQVDADAPHQLGGPGPGQLLLHDVVGQRRRRPARRTPRARSRPPSGLRPAGAASRGRRRPPRRATAKRGGRPAAVLPGQVVAQPGSALGPQAPPARRSG